MTDLRIIFLEVTNVSPSILIPFYDEDSSTLFLAGKGENVITAYEVGNSCFVQVDLAIWGTNYQNIVTGLISQDNSMFPKLARLLKTLQQISVVPMIARLVSTIPTSMPCPHIMLQG